ncbi:diaminopimelate epimerase [Thermodesulfobacterium sp. TA1]|uniref:diaminopimelate epimerase n=1 Tax=Thermodesulfobacterium sp. TA1 TaxID=2234087 RepID=UPI0012321404|nr:diaminopimelate epimerase [Thermodesulfobacterium sp. TA1]QER42827.1 diaminopimelate epimerase [Thermodesulfobacterium sp. TA1]
MEEATTKTEVGQIGFYKLCASGNDFIVILNFSQDITPEQGSELAKKLCRSKFSVSADGLILIERPSNPQAKFAWRFYNSDGSEAEMCGNGARCVARLVTELGLFESPFYFETKAGLIYAEVKGKRVKVALTSPKDLKLNLVLRTDYDWFLAHFVNTGVPHTVIFWEDIENAPVNKIGPKIRYHEAFSPAGTNVNFINIVEKEGKKVIQIRTYERGVEGETLACGTGSAASAYIAYKLGLVTSPVNVLTRGGEILTVYIEEKENKIYLEGDTLFVFKGVTLEDALK